MTDTAVRLAGPISLPNSATTLYTVPAATTTIVRSVLIVNVTGSAATLVMSIGVDAIGTRILPTVTVPANGLVVLGLFAVLVTGETLRATGGTNNALTLTISGVETI